MAEDAASIVGASAKFGASDRGSVELEKAREVLAAATHHGGKTHGCCA